MRIILPNNHLRDQIDVEALVATAQNPPDWGKAIKDARKYLRAEKAAKEVFVIAECDRELILGQITRSSHRILWWFERGTSSPPPHWDWDWD